mmetsp:Transcript_89638/g.172552  ORF Transcript_89638/g.172552 Transcript_89638/m.172552 type:complete len:82 (-) Transcript_89638:289-534(-)
MACASWTAPIAAVSSHLCVPYAGSPSCRLHLLRQHVQRHVAGFLRMGLAWQPSAVSVPDEIAACAAGSGPGLVHEACISQP